MAAVRSIPIYKLGTGIEVSMVLHNENRLKLCTRMKETNKINPNSIILLKGGENTTLGGSDADIVFRQESYFHWTFGVLEPSYFGGIDLSTGSSFLFMPKLDEVYEMYMGKLETPNKIKQKYAIDEVYYVDEIQKVLQKKNVLEIHVLYGLNTDSHKYTTEASFPGIEKFKVVKDVLHGEIAECRVTKSSKELDVMRYVNVQSSFAHRELMRSVKPNMYEYQVESTFLHNCYFHGAMRNVAYTSIGATGCNCSILHYGHAGQPNERKILDGDMCLFDMGGEYYCYTSDITCSYPVNGKFSPKQRVIYETVLAARNAVLEKIKAGVEWTDMHLLAERVTLEKLKEAGLLQGDVNEMIKANLGAIFMPHGLGHLMGCDVHDVGGYLEPAAKPRSTRPGLKFLRMNRPLLANMVVTVEPGCYFIDFLLNRALNEAELSKFLVKDAIEKYRGFGGVRIEDDVIITTDGHEIMTKVPRTIEEIEAWMSGKDNHSKYQ